jgi:3-hydroxyacyl-CoA dehydrogenase/enoyl-CoA hydratase/3-hydroxybutyryl-CoA epimerase
MYLPGFTHRLFGSPAARAAGKVAGRVVRDADVGAILGWGFAPYTGGPLSLIDTVGTKKFAEECADLAGRFGKRFTPPKLLAEMAAKGETFYERFNPKKAD